jgi:hypothetical protein
MALHFGFWPVPQGSARASTPSTSINEDRQCSSLRAVALAAKTINPARWKDQMARFSMRMTAEAGR